MIEKGVKLAHISDLHLAGAHDNHQISLLETLLGAIRESGCEHIVITGDLVDSIKISDWKIVKEVLQSHDLYHWEKVTLIPGNHDLISLEEEVRIYNALNPDTKAGTKRLRKRMDEFSGFFRELITGDDTVTGFPYIKVLDYGALRISLVVVNTVFPWNSIDNPLGARGNVSQSELRLLLDPSVDRVLRDSFVIGVFHHAYRVYGTDVLIDQAFDWTMELKNRDELLWVMQCLHARILLHGHFHRFQSYMADGMTVVNGGSFSYNPRRYSEMTITSEGNVKQRFVDI